METNLLFPERIFLESEDERALAEELRKYSVLKEIKNGLFVVGKEEERLLKTLCDEKGNLRMSKGIIQKGVPQIIKGPLKGMESRIRKIDRHKRLARVEAVMYPMKTECSDNEWQLEYILAGLEIIDKIG